MVPTTKIHEVNCFGGATNGQLESVKGVTNMKGTVSPSNGYWASIHEFPGTRIVVPTIDEVFGGATN